MKRYLPVLIGLLPALVLPGCGSSGGSTRIVTRTVTPASQTPSASSTATSITATAVPPASTSPSSTPICRAADLSLSYLGQQGAAGHGEIGFELKNTSSVTCHSFGFPGVLFLDKNGAGLTTVPQHTTTDYFGHATESEVTLAPNATASFRLGVTHGAVPGSVCTTAYGLQVIPPNDTSTLRVTIPGGTYECRDVTVSPLEPGNSAYV